MKKLIFISFIAILAACSAKVVVPTQADADRGASKFAGVTVEDLTTGKTNYETYCGTCHELQKPKAKTEAEWKKIVPNMVKMVNKKGEKINPEMEEKILRYLVVMGQK